MPIGLGLLSNLEEIVDLGHRRQLNKGFGDALSRAFEIAATPAIMGLLGWWIDGRVGTRPLFMLFFGAFTICYVTWKQFRDYDAAMRREEAKLLGGRAPDLTKAAEEPAFEADATPPVVPVAGQLGSPASSASSGGER